MGKRKRASHTKHGARLEKIQHGRLCIACRCTSSASSKGFMRPATKSVLQCVARKKSIVLWSVAGRFMTCKTEHQNKAEPQSAPFVRSICLPRMERRILLECAFFGPGHCPSTLGASRPSRWLPCTAGPQYRPPHILLILLMEKKKQRILGNP